MSVSHPNCVTTYKLSMIRLLRGADLVDSEHSNNNVDTATDGSGLPAPDASSRSIPEPPRHVHSLLSGAEGVEVADPYGPLAPGLYETWMVLEVCGGWEGWVDMVWVG